MSSKPEFEVTLAHDGPELSPRQMGEKLARLTAEGSVEADYYSNDGAVADLETAMAGLLGKERAVMFPTGTLANLMALRLLAGPDGGRVVVHRQSHLFNDSGENLSRLGGFTMVPLDDTGAGFSAIALTDELQRRDNARVATTVGCVAIESPVRRLHGARFPADDLENVIALAKSERLPLFYDGARMMIEAAYTDRRPSDMAAPFDLVYVSLYKYLSAPFGCVIAGEAGLLDDVFHDRRRFGGGIYQSWPAALLALDHLPGHLERWREAIASSEAVIEQLSNVDGLTVRRVESGTNIFMLECPDGVRDSGRLVDRAAQAGLRLPPLVNGTLAIKINETWCRWDADRLASTLAGVILETAS
ncbi:MAG: aminotransferase class I/II-fold pyridoxal phosphate-dependent enzyme [Pseudomonadota bacterium]